MVVSWIQKICNQALKVEDKMLPLLAQHWARISRTLQGNAPGDEVKLLDQNNIFLFYQLT